MKNRTKIIDDGHRAINADRMTVNADRRMLHHHAQAIDVGCCDNNDERGDVDVYLRNVNVEHFFITNHHICSTLDKKGSTSSLRASSANMGASSATLRGS